MIQSNEIKNCLYCDKPIKGRSDKKFCDTYCRAAYNNALKSLESTQMKDVNHALTKNRKILRDLLPDNQETVRTTQEKLLEKGFLFKYITHLSVDKSGKTFYYCYDYGYLPLDMDRYQIVKRKEE